ncbi:MAG TPA: sirohydrochlorin chelatase, partial [Cyanobacteria bacterium UBA11148]|nr:sirohydrochlorin chelatase [Cyanobacteria bacterium UBA11148]
MQTIDTLDTVRLTPESPSLPPLPLQRPLLMIGHGSRDSEGRQNFLEFANAYQSLDSSRPVIPCFLELTNPTIQEGVDSCVAQGYKEFSVLPILLFAARHNKFDVTNELDRAKSKHPQIKFYYGRHLGITPRILDLWRRRLTELDQPLKNPKHLPNPQSQPPNPSVTSVTQS